jgi:hypothetical protein
LPDPYPEIKVPKEFIVKFEMDKGIDPGIDIKAAKREL